MISVDHRWRALFLMALCAIFYYLCTATETKKISSCSCSLHGTCGDLSWSRDLDMCHCDDGFGGRRCDFDNGLLKERVGEQAGVIFDKIYQRTGQNVTLWDSEKPPSGVGSSLAFTRETRTLLKTLIHLHDIRSIFDVPCGDFVYMKETLDSVEDLGLHRVYYLGGDISKYVVDAVSRQRSVLPFRRFIVFDLLQHAFPPADMVVIRDVMFHLPMNDGATAIRKVIDSGCRFLVTTSFRHVGDNDVAFRSYAHNRGFHSFYTPDLSLSPFSLGPPLLWVAEEADASYKTYRNTGSETPVRGVGVWSCRKGLKSLVNT